ncbi:DUF4391 domain-containing protein [Halomonas meridiana]|jgi:hypothetical protein|uniref:DUF4391 domain-containing protein n=1 Tax=Vreelandella aquamarina TaxID=77097 RepID=UPI001E450879|nr:MULTISPECIES: DUF4391 domain-containing protein [Halomonas]MCD1652294.1 DUF4391 domain-containing protein [Halomonas axialensis]MCD2088422.1 DUF4391 domain-containing protein [Halomonas meridiana]
MTLYAWPKQAAFGRVVPKSKIYEHATASAALRERFVQQVEQINWAYKLAPETVNLPATPAVTEIQVFRLSLKGASLDQDVLKAIDRAIPFPLIFELAQGGRIKLTAAYKRPAPTPKSAADSSRWVVGSYFETDWQPESTLRQPLPVALDMAGLYEQLLSPLVQGKVANATDDAGVPAPQIRDCATAGYTAGTPATQPERLTLEQHIELAEAIVSQQKQVERIRTRLGREKQFNKRVAINAELRDAKQQLQRLIEKQAATQRY